MQWLEGSVVTTTGTGNPVDSAYTGDDINVDVCIATAKTGIKVKLAKGSLLEF